MADKNIKVTLTLKDDGSVHIKKFANTTNTSLKKVQAQGIKTSKMFAGITTQLKFMAAAAVAAGIAVSIALGKSAIKASSDLQEATGKFEVVFKGLVAEADKMATELTKSYGLSTRAAKEYMSSIGDLLKPLGLSTKASLDMSSAVTKLAVDIGSFSNRKTADVIRDIQSALTGEYQTMKKYGVVLNEASIKQEALRMGLVQIGEALTPTMKAQAAYSLIVKGSADANNDFIRTSRNYANQVKIMEGHIENIKAAIGDKLRPAITEIISSFNDWASKGKNVKNAIDNITIVLKLMAAAATIAAAAMGALLLTMSATAIMSVWNAAKAIWAVVTAAKAYQIAMGGTLTTWVAFTGAMTIMATNMKTWTGGIWLTRIAVNALGVEYLALTAAVGTASLALTTFNILAAALLGLGIGYWLEKEFEWAKKAAIALTDGIIVAFLYIQDAAKRVGAVIKIAFNNAFNGVKEAYAKMLEAIAKGLSYIPGGGDWAAGVQDAADKVKGSIKDVESFGAAMKRIGEETTYELKVQALIVEKWMKKAGIGSGGFNDRTAEIKAAMDKVNKLGAGGGGGKKEPFILKKPDSELRDQWDYGSDKDTAAAINSAALERFATQQELEKKQTEMLRQVHIERHTIRGEANQAELDQITEKYILLYEQAVGNAALMDELKENERLEIEKVNKKIDADANKTWKNIGSYIGSSFLDNITDVVTGAQSITDAFKSMAADVGKFLVKLALKMMILAAAKKALESSTAGGGWATALEGIIGAMSADGNILKGGSGITEFAGGGIVSKPTLSLAGEGRYNEAIVPLPNGKAIPVDMNGSQGNTYSVVVNVDGGKGGTRQENDRLGKQLAREMREEMKKLMIDERRYNGVIGKQSLARAY